MSPQDRQDFDGARKRLTKAAHDLYLLPADLDSPRARRRVTETVNDARQALQVIATFGVEGGS